MSFSVLILPIAIFALTAAANRGEGWRDAWLRALVCFGGVVAVLTELLGAGHAIHRGPVFLAWCAIAAGAILARRHSRKHAPIRLGIIDSLSFAGVAAILGIVLLTALLSPPNSADAMAYHLPRVLFWAQSGSVEFFPTTYFNQITLQPLAEYLVLHTCVLSGGDHFANLVQWLGLAGSAIGVSAVTAAFGASVRAQVFSALFCATLPNGILQASGAKNDYLLAMWMVAMCYFARRYVMQSGRQDLIAAGLALALALFTKATAYLYAPPMLAVIWWPFLWSRRRDLKWVAVVLIASVLAVNGTLYWRNFKLSGSPLGYDSARGDGFFRWRNEHFGWRETVSNLLRHGSEELGSPSARWNHQVYAATLRAHAWIGIDASDPATTWPWTKFEPPRYTNHEADANNRWHLLLLALSLGVLWKETRQWVWYASGIAIALLLFCFYLKWQLFMSRLLLPLFVVASPVAGRFVAKWKWPLAQAALGLFLLNNARPFLFENWTRPLKGPQSLWRTSRDHNYFNDMTQWGDLRVSYRMAVDRVTEQGCKVVGVDTSQFQLEYPFEALLRERMPDARFLHSGVKNASVRYAKQPSERPCAVVCLLCSGIPQKRDEYREYPRVVEAGPSLLFFRY